jgi:hypothetical protein
VITSAATEKSLFLGDAHSFSHDPPTPIWVVQPQATCHGGVCWRAATQPGRHCQLQRAAVALWPLAPQDRLRPCRSAAVVVWWALLGSREQEQRGQRPLALCIRQHSEHRVGLCLYPRVLGSISLGQVSNYQLPHVPFKNYMGRFELQQGPTCGMSPSCQCQWPPVPPREQQLPSEMLPPPPSQCSLYGLVLPA